MRQRGFNPDFPPAVQQQLAYLRTHPPQISSGKDVRDLRTLLWSSIDNDTSRDLDQIEVAELLANGEIRYESASPMWTHSFPKIRDRPACRPRNHHRLRRSPKLSHAAGRAFHRQDFPARKSGLLKRSHRVCRRRRPRNFQRRLSCSGSQSRATPVQLGWRLAGRHGRRATQASPFRRSSGPASSTERSRAETEKPALCKRSAHPANRRTPTAPIERSSHRHGEAAEKSCHRFD